MNKMEILQKMGYNSEQVDLVCNKTNLDFRPIQQGIDADGKAVYQNCHPEHDIIAQQLYHNNRPVRKGLLVQDLAHGGRWYFGVASFGTRRPS